MTFESATRTAVLAPLAAGCVWAALTFASWHIAASRPEASMATMIAFWAVGLLGVVGLGLLLVPLMIGLTTRSPDTRLAAAWVGAALCALAGAFWLLGSAAWAGLPQDVLAYLAGAVLLAPLQVTWWASRKRSGERA
jgi:hypothetical protein